MTMILSTYWWLLRPLLALICSYFIARRMRHFLLSLVIKSMPVTQRYSEDGFKKQTRIVSRLGIGLTILLTIGIEVGYRYAFQPNNKKADSSHLPTQNMNLFPTVAPTISPTLETTPTNQIPPRPISTPATISAPTNSPVSRLYYLQLAAFSDPTHVQKAKAAYVTKVPHPLYLAIDQHPTTPFKVVVGPFASILEVRQYQLQYGLRGYVRSAELLQIWQAKD